MLSRRATLAVFALAACLFALSGCGPKKAGGAPGQALASVNGVEITVLQLNDELARAGVGAAAQEAASKQLLQALIDRQLLQDQAVREQIDRDPKVMQAIERARALIVAQAYLQKRVGTVARPTSQEVENYYRQHPQFFQARKQFAMDQLQLPASALTTELKALSEKAGSLDEVAAWLDARHVAFSRSHVARSTADLAPPLAARLLAMHKGQVFTVQEGERALVVSLADVREAPVTLALASPQIEQFLTREKQKESAAGALARLRASARIEYLDKTLAAPAVQAGGAAASDAPTSKPDAALARGVAGLK